MSLLQLTFTKITYLLCKTKRCCASGAVVHQFKADLHIKCALLSLSLVNVVDSS